jgi:cellobiose transport system substrate-binding protein
MHLAPTRVTALIATGAAATLILGACGSGPAQPAQQTTGPITLSVSLFGTFGYDEVGLFKEYEASHPGITITYESTQGEDKYWPALQTRLTSGSGVSDIQGIEVGRIADVVTNSSKYWTDLRGTPAAANAGGYVSWKEPEATTSGGAVLGMGTDIGPLAICYRTDLLGQAGLPTDPAALSAQLPSWDAYLALGAKYKAAAPKGSSWLDSAGGLYNTMVSTGKEIYYDSGGKVVVDTNPAVRTAFDRAAGAARDGLTAKLDQFVDPGWDAGFGSGAFATIECPAWMLGYIKGKAGDAGSGKWNVTALPGGQGGNWGGSYLGIPASSPHKAQAGELIAWLTAPAQQTRVFQAKGNFPSTTAGISSIASTTDPYFTNAPIGKIFSDSATAAPVQLLGPEDGTIKNIMTRALLSVETNGVSPADAWNTAVRQVKDQVG